MKAYTDYLWFNTKNRQEFINITTKVEEAVRKSGVKEGLCLVNAMHITASCLRMYRTQCMKRAVFRFRIYGVLA